MFACALVMALASGGCEDTFGPLEPANEPAPRATASKRPPAPSRPGGSPVGIAHDLPEEGESLDRRPEWEKSFKAACKEKGQPAGCLKIDYDFFEEQQNGDRVKIPDIGVGEDYEQDYDECFIGEIEPPTGSGKTIPSGSRVKVIITCTPKPTPETEQTTTEPSG